MANVLLGSPVTVNVTLELAAERTTMNVTGEAPLIQSENGDVSTLNQQQIADVPNPGGDNGGDHHCARLHGGHRYRRNTGYGHRPRNDS
jgi:hypothetical protein